MKRMHVHVSVTDLHASVRFYSTLFAASPAVLKSDYAKWLLDDPRESTIYGNEAPESAAACCVPSGVSNRAEGAASCCTPEDRARAKATQAACCA